MIVLARRTGGLFASRLAAQALLLVATVVLARRLGEAGFGGVAAIVAAVYLANVVTTFGTDMVLIREIAAGRGSRWAAALVLQLALAVVAFGLLAIASWLLASPPEVAQGLLLYGLALVPLAFFGVATAVLRGQNRMGAYGVLGVGAAAAQAGGVVLGVGPGSTVVDVAAILLGVQVVAALLAWALAGLGIGGLRTSRAEVFALARSSAPVAALGSVGVAFQRLPIVVLAGFVGVVAAGWFAAAQRLVDASKTGHLALFTATYPAMAADRSGSNVAWARRASIAGAAFVAGATILLADPLVRALYGLGFEPAIAGLQVLAWAVVPSTLAGFRSLELLAAGRERAVLRWQFVALAVLAIGSVALLPPLGWIGVAWALVAAESVQAVGLEVAVRRRPALGRAPASGSVAGAASGPASVARVA